MIALALAVGCRDGGGEGDGDGEALADGTGSAVTSPAVRLDAAAAAPADGAVRACATDDGRVHVLWAAGGDGEADVWAASATDGGWTPPVRVSDAPGDVQGLELACADGLVAVWSADRGGDGDEAIWAARSDDGATWDDDRSLDERDLAGRSVEPSLAADGDRLVVAWADDRNGTFDVLTAASTDGGRSWASSVRVDSDLAGGAWSGHPRAAVAGDDTWIVWEDTRDGDADIRVARSTNGGVTFGDDQRLDDADGRGASMSLSPAVCLLGADLTVVWSDASPGDDRRDIHAVGSSDAGDTWSASERVDLRSAPASLGPACARDLVGWFEAGDDVVAVSAVDAGAPTGEVVVLGPARGSPRIASTGDAAAWIGEDGAPWVGPPDRRGEPILGHHARSVDVVRVGDDAIVAWTTADAVWVERVPLAP